MNPVESVTLTIRLIRSFEYRNVKNIVVRDINLEDTTQKFKEQLLSSELHRCFLG